jgi:hypothetical protein
MAAMCNMLPVGVIEVKKPDNDSKSVDKRILDMPTVLGELYDFQMQLLNFYEMMPAFGILTTFETCRVCWIPTETGDADRIAETSESCLMPAAPFITPRKQTAAKKKSPPGLSFSKLNPTVHRVDEEEATNAEVKKVLAEQSIY